MALLEFIQILLLVLLILPACTCYTVSESTSDTIYANEIAYFNVASTRPVIVALLSTEGDVDAYASPTSKNPKPSGVDYDFCSASCGMDLLMLPMSAESSKYTLGLFGHMRYEKSVYKLFIIEPSEEDIQYFQIWDWDYEKGARVLLVDADHMVLLNDPVLIDFVEQLGGGRGRGTGGERGESRVKQKSFLKDAAEFGAAILLKILEVAIEILAA